MPLLVQVDTLVATKRTKIVAARHLVGSIYAENASASGTLDSTGKAHSSPRPGLGDHFLAVRGREEWEGALAPKGGWICP